MTAAGGKRHGAAARGLSAREIVTTAAKAAGEGKVTVGELIDAFGRRAYGTLLFFLGAIMLTPVGAIPGAPLVTTVLVALLMGQSVLRKGAPWLPAWVREAEIDSARLQAGLRRIEPWADRVDRITRPRLTALFEPPMMIGWSIACVAIALSMIPLGLIPFAAAVPSLSLALIGLGMINLDGAAAALGAAVALAAGALVVTTVTAVPV
jgi:hypothetical protein